MHRTHTQHNIMRRGFNAVCGVKKTAVQQLEQQPLFSFNRPEEVAALSSCDFTVALPKFTIPDKKVLIIEIQERNGGRHFYYKLKNKQLINAEILFPEIVGKP